MRHVLFNLTALVGGVAISLLVQTPDAPRTGGGPSGAGGPPGLRGPGGGRTSRGIPAVVTQMLSKGDKDADKELTKEELTGLADAWFDKLDPEGIGKLTQELLTARLPNVLPAASGSRGPAAGAPPGGGRGPDGSQAVVSPEVLGPILFTATDTDKDGSLTRTEFKQTFAKWFDDWDVAKTGKLNEDTLRRGLDTALPRPNTGGRGNDAGSRPRSGLSLGDPDATRRGSDRPSAPDQPGVRSAKSARGVPERSTTSQGGRDFAAFTIISELNIFDSNRRARRRGAGDGGDEPRPKRTDTMSLVGTLTSEKGTYAFFDGTSVYYRKVLEPGKSIAGYKIAEITGNGVKLEGGTNLLELRVGMQLRREEEGAWSVVAGSGPQLVPSGSSSTSSSESSSADEDEIVKKLMQQREQELK